MEKKQLRSVEAEPVIGLTLQLQKFGVGKSLDENDLRANTILGHYDHLVIRKVRKWLEYSPRMDWEGNDQQTDIQSGNLLATHYPIKLLFPDEKETEGLQEFFYGMWKNYETLLEENPCMTVVLLNLTDMYKTQINGSLLHELLSLLKRSCEPKLLSEVHCCVLPSLGYSDFCILMAGKDWKPALRMVELLHSLTVPAPGENRKIPVLSTDYMMPVCHPKTGASLDGKFSNTYFKDIELTVRVNLCPGVTAQQLADYLENIQVYRTSGGSDCLLWAKDEQIQELMSALMRDTERNLVIDMVSTPQLRLTPSYSKDPQLLSLMSKKELIWDADSFKGEVYSFKEAIRCYAEHLRVHNRHNRQANALWELAAIIEGVCVQPHTGLLRGLMKDLINGFSSCLRKCTVEMSQPDWDFSEMEEYVSEFTAIVGSFLEDLSRSDCFFMEREKYNHASVSSATSLLIVYNQWLNEFTNTVRKATQEENQSCYSFLVTCGGRDQTQTTNAFYFLKPEIKGANKDQLYEELPLVIQMSEMSLFDFSGTILRSFHECMHYTGERRRRDRLHHFLQFIISMLSERIAMPLLDREAYIHTQEVLEQLRVPDGLKVAVEEAFEEHLHKLSRGIAALLWEYFPESEREEWTEWNYLSGNVQIWAYEVLFAAFSGHVLDLKGGRKPKLRQNRLAARMYDLTMETQKAYYQECAKLCRDAGISTVIFDYGARQLEELQNMDGDSYRRANEMLSCQIQMILSRLLISEPPQEMPVGNDPKECQRWNQQFPYFMLVYQNVYTILQGATDIFSEAFADVAACTILDVSLEDYLLMHVYEEWDLDSALCREMSSIYRVSAVLRLCFLDCLENNVCLSHEARRRMEAAVTRLAGHGMPKNRLNAQALCNQVDLLLKDFAATEETGAPLLEYLSDCRRDYSHQRVKEEMDKFSKSFQKIRLLAVDPEGEDLHEKLVEMHSALCGGWRDKYSGRSDKV